MQRTIRKPRFPVVQRGKLGRLALVHRSVVCPGETMQQLRGTFRIQSLPTEYVLAGATVDIWFFAVPVRAAWDGFVDFLMSGGAAPTASGTNVGLFNSGSETEIVKGAVASIVNNYFRTDEDTEYTYSAAGDPALPIVDMTAEGYGSTAEAAQNDTVSTAGDVLNLEELREAQAQSRYDQKINRLDGRYESYLSMCGVDVGQAFNDAPEIVGHHRKFIYPQKTVDPSTGFPVQSYAYEAKVSFNKKRFFREHHIVLGYIAVRPKINITGGIPLDAALTEASQWPHPGQLADQKISEDHNWFSTDPNDTEVRSVDDVLWRGQHLGVHNYSAYFTRTNNFDSRSSLRFPTTAWDSFVDTTTHTQLGGYHFEVDGVSAQTIATPLKRLTIQ